MNTNTNIRFIHLRNVYETLVPHETPESSSRMLVVQSIVSGQGGMTVAYQLSEDKQTLTYAVAKCHWRDQYCKKTGRIKAAGRLKSKQAVKIPAPEDRKLSHAVLESIKMNDQEGYTSDLQVVTA